MNNNETKKTGCGSFFLGVIFAVQVLFIIFKLTAIITWAWLWVLMPVILIIAALLVLYGLYLLITFIEEVSANGK